MPYKSFFCVISFNTYYFCSTLYSCVSFRNELLPILHLYITTMLCATIYPFIRNIILIAATSYTLSQCTLSGKDDMLYSLQLFDLPLQNIGYERVYLFVWGYLMKFMVFHKYTKTTSVCKSLLKVSLKLNYCIIHFLVTNDEAVRYLLLCIHEWQAATILDNNVKGWFYN